MVKGMHACKQQGLDGRRLGNIETELEGQFHARIILTLEASGKILYATKPASTAVGMIFISKNIQPDTKRWMSSVRTRMD